MLQVVQKALGSIPSTATRQKTTKKSSTNVHSLQRRKLRSYKGFIHTQDFANSLKSKSDNSCPLHPSFIFLEILKWILTMSKTHREVILLQLKLLVFFP
jgi:hypothetical protein